MFVTGKYQGRHRETRQRETPAREPRAGQPRAGQPRAGETRARGRARFGLRIVAAITCAALLTAWPAPRYN
jgi:hypothetical protein